MSNDKLQMIPTDRALELNDAVNAWWNSGGRVSFNDARFVAIMAILEFLANNEGYTYYGNKVGLEWRLEK